jgi:hypothetical protein
VQNIKQKLSALLRLQGKSRVLFVLYGLLVIAIVFIGFDNPPGIILGILAVMMIIIELTRRWRKIRNFVMLFFASFIGVIFLAFLHEEVVTPLVTSLLGDGALNSRGFLIFNQIISLFMLFVGSAGLIVGLSGTVILGIVRLVAWKNRGRTATGT